MSTSTNERDVEKLARLIRGVKVAMLTTAAPDGTLRSRPMVTQQTDGGGTLWFFTQAQAPKVGEVERHEQVNVSYAAPDDERYVSVSGTARVVRDPQKIKELWDPLLKAWFPKGPDDPEVALLRVDVERAEYWDAPSSTMVHLVGLAKALATGQPYRPGENRKLDLEGGLR